MSENEKKSRSSRDDSRFQALVTLIFAAVIAVLCALLFIYNYKAAYDENTNGGFFSPSDGVVFIYVQVALASFLVSGILKAIWDRCGM